MAGLRPGGRNLPERQNQLSVSGIVARRGPADFDGADPPPALAVMGRRRDRAGLLCALRRLERRSRPADRRILGQLRIETQAAGAVRIPASTDCDHAPLHASSMALRPGALFPAGRETLPPAGMDVLGPAGGFHPPGCKNLFSGAVLPGPAGGGGGTVRSGSLSGGPLAGPGRPRLPRSDSAACYSPQPPCRSCRSRRRSATKPR